MAAVGTAMYRPGGSLDPSCYATQRIYDNPDTLRPKKWSSKLKLNTSGSSKSSEKSPESLYMYGTISAPGGSALSKSMKYAETWLYGSIKNPATPMRPSVFSAYPEVAGPLLISTPQKPIPHNYAVILCSCPEYLNGTKKSSSTKVSICKKCKGSRLPLTIADSPRMLIGGTVRGPQIARDAGILRPGTVKVQNSKSRPSILKQNGEADPYDLMRRSRLAPPHETRIGSQFTTAKSRAKSISPCRAKTKKLSPETLRKNRSKSIARVNNVWVDEEITVESKRSILTCDINPYELIKSSNSSNSTEIPSDDEYRSFNISSCSKSISKSKSENNIKAISGQRIRIGEAKNASSSNQNNYQQNVNYDLKNEFNLQNSSNFANHKKDSKSLLISNKTKSSPKRPPRRTRTLKTDDDSESDSQNHSQNHHRKLYDYSSELKITKCQNHNDTIKSILKKPKNYDTVEFIKAEPKDQNKSKRGVSSQFYLPKPKDGFSSIYQRKKVQFQMENDETKIIYTAEFNLQEQSRCDVISNRIEETEIDEIAQGDVVSKSLITANGLKDHPSNIQKLNEITTSTESKIEIVSIEPFENNNTDENKISLSDTLIPKISILRRSESERLSTGPTVPAPKFIDTMALRPKNKIYGHTSQVFLGSSSETETTSSQVTLCDRDGYTPMNFNNGSNTSLFEFHNVNDSGNLSDSSDITRNVLQHLRRGVSPEPPPRIKTRDRTKSKKNNYVKTRFVRNNSNCSTSDESSDGVDYEQKTVLKIKQFDSDSSEEYKEISQNDHVTPESESRKTSIQINGSDCYSTMNVGNNSSIYLSSVVINAKDEIEHTDLNQSQNKVTISLVTPQKENQLSNSKIYISSDISASNLSDSNNYYEEYQMSDNSNSFSDSISINSSLLNDPVEAVKQNLIPHVCHRNNEEKDVCLNELNNGTPTSKSENKTFVKKIFHDPFFGHLAEGLDSDLVKKLIENSLIKLQETKNQNGTEKEMTVEMLIEDSLKKLKNEDDAAKSDTILNTNVCPDSATDELKTQTSTENENGCSAPYESMEYECGAAGAFSDLEPMSDCYNASASELSTEDDNNSTRSKFYQMLVDAALCDIEISNNNDDDHHYECIRLNADPIYEEIGDMPPPLPINPPPLSLTVLEEEKCINARSIFEGASKYDILSYLVDAKERGIDDEEAYITSYGPGNETSVLLEESKNERLKNDIIDKNMINNTGHLSNASDSSEENSLVIHNDVIEKTTVCKKSSIEIERNDSGVGSETSKSSRSRLQGKTSPTHSITDNDSPIHLCEDCDTAVDTQVTEKGTMYAPLVCRKCAKKRAERKEILSEIVETEEKYGRDLQIILEEFYKPMLVAGLLTQEQLGAIFLNVEELIENNQVLSEKLRDALEIAVEQGDEDLLTVNVGKIILECSGMLTAFQSYCVKQAGAALLLAGLEKEKELLRIFLRVSQMENVVLRRMNLNSFLMVPVQRVTKYPLLLSRLHRATAVCAAEREDVKAAQRCVESRLEEMNSAAEAAAAAARDVPLWRRLAAARRTAHDLHVADIRLRKMAVDVLDWNHDDARFAMEGKLLFTQPNDNNWRKGRTIKLTPISALLVTNGKPTTLPKLNEIRETREARDREAKERENELFARSGVREAALLLVREKAGRYTLQREPLFLDRCVVAADHEPEHFFEVHEITSKDSYIFKAEENNRTRTWYRQLQYHAQGAGAWRKRRNALANIMINPMLTRN